MPGWDGNEIQIKKASEEIHSSATVQGMNNKEKQNECLITKKKMK